MVLEYHMYSLILFSLHYKLYTGWYVQHNSLQTLITGYGLVVPEIRNNRQTLYVSLLFGVAILLHL